MHFLSGDLPIVPIFQRVDLQIQIKQTIFNVSNTLKMKNLCLLSLLIVIAGSCSKSSAESTPSLSDVAIVSEVRYACGPSCDASAWVVKLRDQTWYEPVSLPNDFKINDLAVTVVYKRTGQRSAPGQGTGDEKIEILRIAKR